MKHWKVFTHMKSSNLETVFTTNMLIYIRTTRSMGRSENELKAWVFGNDNCYLGNVSILKQNPREDQADYGLYTH